MDNEKSFYDGISVLEILLKKFLISFDISDEEAKKYFIMFPIDKERAFDYDREFFPKTVARFPLFISEDGENAVQTGTLIVLLEDGVRIIGYDSVSDEDRIKGNFITKKVSELDFNNNYDGVVALAEVFYLATNVRRYPLESLEYEKAYKIYLEATKEYMNKLKATINEEENFVVPTIQVENQNVDTSVTIDVSELPPDFVPIQKTPLVNDTINVEENLKTDIEKVTLSDVDMFIERLNAGNSENKFYDFEWNEDLLLNYADDKSLEVACNILERGRLSLELEKNFVVINSYLYGFCDRNETDDEYLEKCKLDVKYREANKVGSWKVLIGRPIGIQSCFNCKYQSCPKRLAAYILYLKNNNLLKEKLLLREKFRKVNEVNNGFFLFNWKTQNGLKNVDDNTFNFANELVDKNFVRVNRNLNKDGYIRVEEIISCKDIQVSNFDIDKINSSYDWEKPSNLNRKIDCEPDSLCSSYTCRMPYCALIVAAYIYYLKKSGQESKLKDDRAFYMAHKEEIDNNRRNEIQKKLDEINEKKEEKLHELKESYEGKIDNLHLTINNIMQSSQTNFHCIVSGEDELAKNSFIDKIIELIKNQNQIKNIRKMPASHFAKLYYHVNGIRINAEDKLIYEDADPEPKAARTYKFDGNNTKYEGARSQQKKSA